MVSAVGIGDGFEAASARRRHAHAAPAEFDSVLLSIHSAQIAEMAKAIGDHTGLAMRAAEPKNSTHRVRVDGETEDARRAEATARRTGTTSIEGGKSESRQAKADARPHASPEHVVRRNATGPNNQSGSVTAKPEPAISRPTDHRGSHPKFVDLVRPGSDTSRDQDPGKGLFSATGVVRGNDLEGADETAGRSAVARTGQTAQIGTAPREPASAARLVGKLLGHRSDGEAARRQGNGQALVSTKAEGEQTDRSRGRHTRARAAGERHNAALETVRSTRRPLFDQLVRRIRLNTGARNSTATMLLDPPSLGRIRIDMRLVDDVMRVRVEASAPHARQLLTERATDLTAALRAHNIAVERWEIVGPSPEQHGGSDASGTFGADEGRQSGRGGAADGGSGRDARRTAHGDGDDGDDGNVSNEVGSFAVAQDVRLDVRI